ncbi:MAG: PilZ domain-containing protein [Myxococcota bacterium]
MGRALRRHRIDTRTTARLPLCAPAHVTTEDGKPAAPLSRCTEIGLGGLRLTAAEGLVPGERVRVLVRLPSGHVFEIEGQVAWAKLTLHPSLFGAPEGRDDDAHLGIAFDAVSEERLLPIRRLFAARDQERQRARCLRQLHGLPIHA